MGQAPAGSDCNTEGKGTIFVKAGEFGATFPVVREWTTRPLKFSQDGDVLICVVGATCGKLNLAINSAIGRSVAAIRPRNGLDTKFLYLQMQPKVLALRGSSTGTAQGVLTRGDLGKIDFVVVPLPEQRRIVAEIEKQFTRLEAGVAALRRVQANLHRYRAAVLKAACEGRLVPIKGKPVKPPELPAGWRWSNLKELKARSMYGPRFSSDDYSDTGYLVLRTTDISEGGKVDTASAPRLALVKEEAAKYKVERGDLLITRTGSLGTLAVFDDDVGAIPGAYLIHYRLAAPRITGKYIFYFLKSPNGQRGLLKGGAGVGRPNLNAPTIEAIPIPLPPLAEQERIVAEVERRLSVVEELSALVTANLQRATRLRQSVLQKAFTGELV